MSLPQIAPFPTSKVRQSIVPAEWSAYVDAWTSVSELYLRLNEAEFAAALSGSESFSVFLTSFFEALAEDPLLAKETVNLRKQCFLLLHRSWSQNHVPDSLLQPNLLADVSYAFLKSGRLRSLLQGLWEQKRTQIEKTLQPIKSSLITTLDSKSPGDAENRINRLGPLLKTSTDAAAFMLTGSDFLDAMSSAYPKTPVPLQNKLLSTTYLGLSALLEGSKPNYSLLSDHLYTLKSEAEQEQKKTTGKSTFVPDLVTNTPLLSRIREKAPEGARVRNVAASLGAFENPTRAKPKRIIRRKVDKGKAKARDDEYGHGAVGDVHVHQMSLVSQIQDLFPDLGAGFVIKLLDEYEDNAEQVTAHLLEDSLPPHLASADRGEKLSNSMPAPPPRFSPRSTPPPSIPSRRNVFDDDEFDRLTVDASRLHVGRKGKTLTADNILADRSAAPAKSAILSALAAFDSDDDERDDTYDVEDVGGTVDSARTGPDEADADLRDKNEEALFRAYSMTPQLFGRDSETRRGKARIALRSETGMTDEAIEGWAIMMARDPKRLRRLEAKFSMFHGQQNELASTAYRGSPADSGAEASGDGQRGGRGGFPGRGRGRGRGTGGGSSGRAGGNVAGSSDDKGTQVSRQRKEASKGSRANHNRRNQRAKKMARGGLPG